MLTKLGFILLTGIFFELIPYLFGGRTELFL